MTIIQTDIKCDSWNYGNLPDTFIKLSFIREQGFLVEMRCCESCPKAVYTQPDSPVYEDSCMECFLCFYPKESNRYLNFEVNANGAMLCQVGSNKTDRVFIRDLGLKQPDVTVKRSETYWEISYLISLPLIQAIYDKSDFDSGDSIIGNFYKCGDKTSKVHYGSWKEIKSSEPNYHLSEYFGEIMI